MIHGLAAGRIELNDIATLHVSGDIARGMKRCCGFFTERTDRGRVSHNATSFAKMWLAVTGPECLSHPDRFGRSLLSPTCRASSAR